jgi:8-oxo-dGTP pyrophosphatase MutT (NUDIX family)
METMGDRISVTVAAVIEHNGRFLMVEEETDNGVRLNQPAGHLEPDESIVAGAARETLEETAYHFVPRALVGIYRWRYPPSGVVYVRFTFMGGLGALEAGRALDQGILRTLWLTPAELRAQGHRHRSPLVMRCVEDYLAGRRYPLDLLVEYDA